MIPFTKEERNTIAEFIFSQQSDILIISDATNLVEVLAKHELTSKKEELLKQISDKSENIIPVLNSILHSKIPSEQGNQIMDEYYGVKEENKPNKEEPSEERENKWGVGKEKEAKAFDTVKIRGEEYDLIHGEFPHSRQDNNTYARDKNNPEHIYGFDGHRLPFKIVIEESNYLKSSHYSGDEIRKSCSGELYLNDTLIYECGGRTYERAFTNIKRFIDDMEEKWSWYPNKTEEYVGNIIKYEGQFFKIERFIISQACMILVTPDGKPRKPFQSESEDVEEGDFDGIETLKVEITSPNIWWFPTEKELAQFKS